MNTTEIRVHLRFMIRRDLEEIIAIEKGAFEFPWEEDDFVRVLRNRNTIGMVAEYGDKVVGFMVYEMHQSRVHLLNFAVSPDYRRLAVGTQMAAKLLGKITKTRRRITMEVRETNLPAQLFWRECGFRAVSIITEMYAETGEDAYLMEYRTVSREESWAA